MVAVRQRQDAHAGPDQPYGGLRQVVQGGPQYLPVPAFRKLDGKPGGRESGLPDIAETVELLIRDDGALHLDQPGVFRRFFQNIGMVADVRGQAHDQFLPDGVDGRVGHLREQLLEIIEQKGGLPGKDGQRGVVPHGAERFRPLHHHGAYDQFHVLLRESEPALVRRQVRAFPRKRKWNRTGNGRKSCSFPPSGGRASAGPSRSWSPRRTPAGGSPGRSKSSHRGADAPGGPLSPRECPPRPFPRPE